ncbi:MAG TPA: aromatic ring-hydroxylating dioxygenase subunit alpha, partial [Alphaproteobacteria bacterium]
DARMHVRVTNLMFPNAIVIPLSDDMTITQWHVPIDDGESWWYAIFSAFATRVDKDAMRAQRAPLIAPPDYKPSRNKTNGYGYDPEEQRSATYTGMGHDINVHDTWAVESTGPIQDRSAEHLGASDRAITAYRKQLLRALDGGARPMLSEAPVSVDTVASAAGWREEWRAHATQRRGTSAWARSTQQA